MTKPMTSDTFRTGAGATGAPRVRVFVGDQESEAVIRQALGDLSLDDFSVAAGNVSTATSLLGKHTSPRLLIVDITGIDDPVPGILSLAEVCEPGVGVVAIGESNDIGLYRQLKHAGVTEYFFKPLIRDQLARSFNDVLTDRLDQPSLFSGRLIFMLGVRGGVGTTTLAANAAWHVAETRQRWTMMVDLDMQGGDAALLFDAKPGHALREAFERPERVDKLFLERGAIHVTKRLNLLAALEPLGSAVDGSEEGVRMLLDNLLRRYRLVIVDLPASTAECLPKVLQIPSTCVLVANPSLTAARDVARWREFIGPNTQERRTLQLLNHTGAHGGLTEAEFGRAAGQAPDIVIPFDKDLAVAANLGVPAMHKCAAFRSGIGRLLRQAAGEPIEKPASLLNRIFRK
jgi:pilus assembly protein CpaE